LIQIVPGKEEMMAYELVKSTTTGAGLFYVGAAETAIFDVTLPPEELPGVSWFADKVNDALIAAAAGEGTILRTKVYYDEASWYDSKYRIITSAHASPLLWTPIIIAALVVIGLGIIAWILQSVTEQPWLGVGLIGLGLGVGALGIAHLVKTARAK
jgi:hypothetical protein